MQTLRSLVNEGVKLTGGICCGFSGNDQKGYSYIMGSNNVPMREKSKEINTALQGKGGGSNEMIQGSVKATKSEILQYFNVTLN